MRLSTVIGRTSESRNHCIASLCLRHSGRGKRSDRLSWSTLTEERMIDRTQGINIVFPPEPPWEGSSELSGLDGQ